MANNSRIYLAGIGMITPLGDSLEKTAAAVSAGVSAFQETEYYSKTGKPFTMALVPEVALPEITYRLNREQETTTQMGVMLTMIDVALDEVMKNHSEEAPVPLLLSGPEAYQNGPYSVSLDFVRYVIEQTGAKIDRYYSRLFAVGRAGVVEAIDLAIRYLRQTDVEYVLVGGADSYQDDELLEYLDSDDRIMSESVMNGFIPGEAAAFLLLTKDISKAMRKNSGVVSLSEPGLAHEEGHMYSSESFRGDGCAKAFEDALDGYSENKVSKIYASINGEQYWAKEYGVAITRAKDKFTDEIRLEHPADCLGDTGAAAGAILIGLAASALYKEGVDNTYLIACSSDQSYRAAICVNFEQTQEGVDK